MTAPRDWSESERAHSNVVRLKVFDHRPHRLSYLDKATVIRFPKEARPSDSFAAHLSYMDAWVDLNRQAALNAASVLALYFKALGVSLRHRSPTMERTSCPIQRGPGTKSLAENGEGT